MLLIGSEVFLMERYGDGGGETPLKFQLVERIDGTVEGTFLLIELVVEVLLALSSW